MVIRSIRKRLIIGGVALITIAAVAVSLGFFLHDADSGNKRACELVIDDYADTKNSSYMASQESGDAEDYYEDQVYQAQVSLQDNLPSALDEADNGNLVHQLRLARDMVPPEDNLLDLFHRTMDRIGELCERDYGVSVEIAEQW